MLTGNASDGAKAAYSIWCNSREHSIYPDPMLTDNLAQKYASQDTENLRIRSGKKKQIYWAAAICAFYDAVKHAVGCHQERLFATQGDYEARDFVLMDGSINLYEEFPLQRPEL